METYNDMVQRVEAARDTFTPEVYVVITNTLDALEMLCKKRDEKKGAKCFMTEPIEVLVLINNPNKMPSVAVHGLY